MSRVGFAEGNVKAAVIPTCVEHSCIANCSQRSTSSELIGRNKLKLGDSGANKHRLASLLAILGTATTGFGLLACFYLLELVFQTFTPFACVRATVAVVVTATAFVLGRTLSKLALLVENAALVGFLLTCNGDERHKSAMNKTADVVY